MVTKHFMDRSCFCCFRKGGFNFHKQYKTIYLCQKTFVSFMQSSKLEHNHTTTFSFIKHIWYYDLNRLVRKLSELHWIFDNSFTLKIHIRYFQAIKTSLSVIKCYCTFSFTAEFLCNKSEEIITMRRYLFSKQTL